MTVTPPDLLAERRDAAGAAFLAAVTLAARGFSKS
jgi:hypothetical protein